MDEQASFEPTAVLGRRRAGWNRLAILVPALAFAVVAWAGLSGPRSDTVEEAGTVPTPAAPAPTGLAAVPRPPSAIAQPYYPTQVLGLDVRRLEDVQLSGLGRDDVTAISGWYVATEITGCPPLAAIYRDASLPELRGDADSWAFCQRSGTLYGSRPDLDQRLPTNNLEDNRSKNAGLPAVWVTLVIGVVVPPELEVIGPVATPVVVVGRFVESAAACSAPAGCGRQLVVDHLAWAAGIGDEQLVDSVGAGPWRQPRLPADGTNVLTGG